MSITPNRIISFVSRGYGGRASDLYITEDCELVERMLEGDTIMQIMVLRELQHC